MGGQAKSAAGRSDAAKRPVFVDKLARSALALFFRRIEVVGLEQVPVDRPVVFVGNHINGLIDPAMLVAYLPVKPRFLAKSTLWSHPLIRPFLELAAAIPVYRREDPGVDATKNAETFAACHAALAAGGAIALFPEGRSHNEPNLVPLKTGVSRIVLDAERAYGGLGIRIVPVGLTFEDKTRFRSRVLMQVGSPLDAAPELELYASDPKAAVRSLTDRIRRALAAVTLNFPSWDEAHLIQRAAELYQRPTAELPAELELERRFKLSQVFIDGYQSLKQRFANRMGRLADAVREYDELLTFYRLSDRQVAASYPSRQVLFFALNSLVLLVARLPLAALGTLLSIVPYHAVRWAAPRLGRDADQIATYKVFGSLLFYPAAWVGEALLVGSRWGTRMGILVLVAAPISAYFALRFHQRRDYFLRESRAYLFLRSGRRAVVDLRRRRGEILADLEELAGLYQEEMPQAPTPKAQSSNTVPSASNGSAQ